MSNLKTVIAAVCICSSLSFAQTYDQVGTRARDLKNYGGAKVTKVHKGEDVYSFRCDIKGWPAIIGSDVPVCIAGVQLPNIVAADGKPNKFFEQQAMKFVDDYLMRVKVIELANIRRGEDFCLVADVIADSNSLAEVLIEKGFAKKLDKTKSINKPSIKNIAEIKIPVAENTTWVASASSKVFHKSSCSSAKRMNKDKTIQFPTRQKAIETGRRPCKSCKP
jgi:micrococcal nuclease